jgi:hypothetical protein
MTPAEKTTSLKLLAALAWADGKLTGNEVESLVDFISSIGPWEGSEIKTVLRDETQLHDQTLRELTALSPPAVAHLLSTANRMANDERPATDSERDVIRRAAEATLGTSRWEQTASWLEAELEAQRQRKAIFGEV